MNLYSDTFDAASKNTTLVDWFLLKNAKAIFDFQTVERVAILGGPEVHRHFSISLKCHFALPRISQSEPYKRMFTLELLVLFTFNFIYSQ